LDTFLVDTQKTETTFFSGVYSTQVETLKIE